MPPGDDPVEMDMACVPRVTTPNRHIRRARKGQDSLRGPYGSFQLAEVAVTGPMVHAILTTIRCLRAPPRCA